jgi:hypothetical protein
VSPARLPIVGWLRPASSPTVDAPAGAREPLALPSTGRPADRTVRRFGRYRPSNSGRRPSMNAVAPSSWSWDSNTAA